MNIYQRMHAVMRELEGINLVKTAGLKFKIIQHDDVTAALRPLYLKHGIVQEVAVQESRQLDGGTTELLVRVTWVNVDDPKDRAGAIAVGHSSSNYIDKASGAMKRDDLGVGKALSYAVKMAQLKNFALLSGDEDLEQQSAKPAPQLATVEQVEAVMNLLAACQTQVQFKVAADRSAEIADKLTPEQTKVMGAAWLAAKKRVENGAPNAPLPESLGGEPREQTRAEKIMNQPGEGLTPGEMQGLMELYKNVRTKTEFAAARVKCSEVQKRCTPAQWQVLAECDQSADRLLRAQQEAAGQ